MNRKIDKKLRAAALARLTEGAACLVRGGEIGAIRAAGRGRASAPAARQLAMYLAHVGFTVPMQAIGTAHGRDRSTVRHACARIEDRRDDPGFECGIAALETTLAAFAGRFGLVQTDDHGRLA